MPTEIFAAQADDVRGAFARVTGVSPETFRSESVHVSIRPEPAPWPFTMLIVGFGNGLVVCADGRYVDWARTHAVEAPSRANYLAAPLAAEAATRGETLHPMPPMIGWALSREPRVAPIPSGYRLERAAKSWMDAWQPRDRFTNALGLAVQTHRFYRNQFAFVLFDADDQPAAVAGVFDTAGLSEIGVDVAEDHRRRNLSSIVVSAACDALMREGKTPFYVCEVRNIRSQHTALASGFLPVCTLSLAMEAGIGIE